MCLYLVLHENQGPQVPPRNNSDFSNHKNNGYTIASQKGNSAFENIYAMLYFGKHS